MGPACSFGQHAQNGKCVDCPEGTSRLAEVAGGENTACLKTCTTLTADCEMLLGTYNAPTASETIAHSKLVQVEGRMNIRFDGISSSNLKEVSFPLLEKVGGNFSIYGNYGYVFNALASMDFGSLSTVGGDFQIYGFNNGNHYNVFNALASMDFGSLSTVGGDFQIYGGGGNGGYNGNFPKLTALDLRQVRYITGGFELDGLKVLTTLDLRSVYRIDGLITLTRTRTDLKATVNECFAGLPLTSTSLVTASAEPRVVCTRANPCTVGSLDCAVNESVGEVNCGCRGFSGQVGLDLINDIGYDVTSLSLNGNYINASVPSSASLDKLKTLDLSGCGLEGVPEDLFSHESLTFVDLRDNQIPSLAIEMMRHNVSRELKILVDATLECNASTPLPLGVGCLEFAGKFLRFSGVRPDILSVNGCRGGGLPVDPPSPPSECPTVGGVNITINGDYFGGAEDAVSVTVDGRECDILERSPTVIVVNLTAGAGVDKTVTVFAYGLLSLPNKNARLSYKRAQVKKLVSSQCNQQGNQLIDCNREGGGVLTIIGSDFGPGKPTVLLGARMFENATHDGDLHEVIVMDLPEGYQRTIPVVVFVSNGEPSTGTATIGYQECAHGEFQNGSSTLCGNCSAGKTSDGLVCADCLPAYFSPAGAAKCTKCRSGFVQPTAGSSSCYECASGKYQKSPEEPCQACPKGTFSNSNGSAMCTDCEDGSVQPEIGSTACDKCLAGKYQKSPEEPCQACPKGTFSNLSGSSVCINCEDGSVQSEIGSTACDKCLAGKYQKSSVEPCQACPKGTFSNLNSSSVCVPCPLGSTSAAPFTTCKCARDFFTSFGDNSSTPDCLKCPARLKFDCGDPSAGFSTLKDPDAPIAINGQWLRSATTPFGAYDCPGGEEACPSHGTECGLGYEGVLCGVCSHGYDARTSGGLSRCTSCPSSDTTFGLGVSVGLAMELMLGQYVKHTLASANAPDVRTAIYTKICFNNIQFMAMAATIPFKWPRPVQALLDAQDTAVSLGQALVSFHCTSSQGGLRPVYSRAMLVLVLLPFSCLVVNTFLMVCKVLHQRDSEEAAGTSARPPQSLCDKPTLVGASLVCSFAMYTTVAQQTMALFACTEIAGISRLVADLSQECFGSQHAAMILGVGMPLIVIMVAIPVATSLGIRGSEQVLFQEEDTPARRAAKRSYAYVVKGYNRGVYWWEVRVVMMRKLAIVVVSIMAWEAKSQAYAVLGVAMVSLLLQVQFAPYETDKGSTGFLSPNRLETLSLSAICLTFYFALFLFEAEANSPELVVLSVVLVLTSSSVLFLALATLLYFLLPKILKAVRDKCPRKGEKKSDNDGKDGVTVHELELAGMSPNPSREADGTVAIPI